MRFLNLNNVAPVQDTPSIGPKSVSAETSPLARSLYVVMDDQGNVIVPGRPTFNANMAAAIEARGWPDLDPSSLATMAAAIEAAAIESGGWPNFDPSSLATTAAAIEAAAIEARGWPDFDPSSLGK